MSEKSGTYQVRVEGSDTFICSNNDDTLLTHLEQQKVEVHFHCREGYCGACRTKLNSGQVEYTTDPLAFIDDDEILPCCCKPTSDISITLY
ncbi:class I ribonucleotide reductase maintenance protein YfaE [Glaciecola sp.]|uniref:class I ribonucleotide reductase maintenance protein YfaE n=1 Tax=Glaciecola sp. MF2-115 TaxID=3384827 RepID=UPI00398980A5